MRTHSRNQLAHRVNLSRGRLKEKPELFGVGHAGVCMQFSKGRCRCSAFRYSAFRQRQSPWIPARRDLSVY